MNINIRLKELRKSKGLTLDALAEKTGFSKGYLSKLERSSKVPPFATVQAIANALDIEVTDMLQEKMNHPMSKNIEVVKNVIQIEEFQNNKNDSPYSFIPILSGYKNKYMHPFVTKISKGITDGIAHDSEEFVYVLEGNLQVIYEDKKYNLSKSDCFYLDSRIRHQFINEDDNPAMLLTVFFNYRRF